MQKHPGDKVQRKEGKVKEGSEGSEGGGLQQEVGKEKSVWERNMSFSCSVI